VEQTENSTADSTSEDTTPGQSGAEDGTADEFVSIDSDGFDLSPDKCFSLELV
jgi:hypothetical protein